ncbi:MAG TPA: capsid cement protein, partial [Anaerolineae bacterium]|nr:capsid cement protein [Anaerolineae bacterium]
VFAHAYSLVAKATGPDQLSPGDVVAVVGVTDQLPGSQPDLPLVRLAHETQFTGLIGVVQSRMVWEPAPGKEEYSLHSTAGSAKSGDYVSLIIYGVAQVKVAPGSNIKTGDRVTASDRAGAVRGLQTRTLDGMIVAESAPTIGIALAAPANDQDTIPVFVTLR